MSGLSSRVGLKKRADHSFRAGMLRLGPAGVHHDPVTAAKAATAHLTPGEGAPGVMEIVHKLPKALLG